MTEIRFRRQPHPYGCNYYSVAALTDVPDGWAEEHESDCSTERMQIRLWEQGYGLWPFYKSYEPADADFWARLVAECGPQGDFFDFQLAIESPTYRGVTHAVGLRLYLHDAVVTTAVVVDTSGHDAPQGFDWPGFLASPYAAALDVRLIWPNDLAMWAPIDGPTSPHALDPAAHAR